MYGTVAKMKVKKENLDKLRAMFDPSTARKIPGARASHVLIPDDWNDEVVIAVFFDDKESYERNADDPAQHEEYLQYRALLEAEPEWTDGTWESYEF